MSNSNPRFNVYVDPRPIDWPIGQYWNPPEQQQQIVRHLLMNQFYPTVNAVNQPTIGEVREMTGFVITKDLQIIRCNDYKGEGEVLLIQWYIDQLTDSDTDVIMNFCAPFYGLGTHRSYVTAKEQELIDAGYMSPVPPLEILQQSAFYGNSVLINPID